MYLFTTRSIRQLTILGFVLVAALLLAALLVTARQLDGLSEQSQSTVRAATQAMSAGRQLIEQSTAMERNARQFTVLGEQTLYQLYVDRRTEFLRIMSDLEMLKPVPRVLELGADMLAREQQAFSDLQSISRTNAQSFSVPEFSLQAYQIADAIEDWIEEQQRQLQSRSEATKQALTVQALLLVIAAAGFMVIFVWLITHPLKQIEQAINNIGSGEYERSIKIMGPRDLQALGIRLEWLRARLAELEQHRSLFLRHVSHELKTPLASMQEGASLLNDGVVGVLTPQQREISVIIANNCQRLQGLIEELLRHHSQHFDVLAAMPEALRFDELIKQVVQAHALAISNKKLRIDESFEKLTVIADAERLRVIIDNLFTNALKFSAQGGVIKMRLHANEQWAQWDIADDGPGVLASEKEQIFEPFFQGSKQDNTTYGGTGLGLAIARDYALAGGGQLSLLESDKGACFRLSFPLCA